MVIDMIKEALRSVKVGGTPRQVPDSRITSSSKASTSLCCGRCHLLPAAH